MKKISKIFHATGAFLYRLKISENLRFSDIFWGYAKRTVILNGITAKTHPVNAVLFQTLPVPFKFPRRTIPNNYASISAMMILQCSLNIRDTRVIK